MSIKEQLMADMKAAMKAKEEGKLALNTIRMARAHIRQAEIDDGHADFNDDQVLAVLRKEVNDAMDPGQRNMGSVMKAVMAKLKGKADGKLINQIVRKLLA